MAGATPSNLRGQADDFFRRKYDTVAALIGCEGNADFSEVWFDIGALLTVLVDILGPPRKPIDGVFTDNITDNTKLDLLNALVFPCNIRNQGKRNDFGNKIKACNSKKAPLRAATRYY